MDFQLLKSKPASHVRKNDIIIFQDGTGAGRHNVVAKVEQHDEWPDRVKIWFGEPARTGKKKSESFPYCPPKTEQIYYLDGKG